MANPSSFSFGDVVLVLVPFPFKDHLAQHMERISALPKTQQKFVMQMIETVLAQQGR